MPRARELLAAVDNLGLQIVLATSELEVMGRRGLRAAGVPTIAVLSGGVSRAELETAGAQSVFDNLRDLCEHLDSTAIGKLATAVPTA